MTSPVGRQKPLLSSPGRRVYWVSFTTAEVMPSVVPLLVWIEGANAGWGTPYHRLYGQMSLGNFTHSDGEMALIAVVLHEGLARRDRAGEYALQ